MGTGTWYSAGALFQKTSFSTAAALLLTTWFSPFWAPKAIQADGVFKPDAFQAMLSLHEIQFCSALSPLRHSKTVQ